MCPYLQGNIIYARDLDDENLRLMRAYPNRHYYRYLLFRDRGEAVLTELHEENGAIVSTPLTPSKDKP